MFILTVSSRRIGRLRLQLHVHDGIFNAICIIPWYFEYYGSEGKQDVRHQWIGYAVFLFLVQSIPGAVRLLLL